MFVDEIQLLPVWAEDFEDFLTQLKRQEEEWEKQKKEWEEIERKVEKYWEEYDWEEEIEYPNSGYALIDARRSRLRTVGKPANCLFYCL